MRPDGMGALEQRANLTINTNESKFIYLHNRFNQTINMKHIKVLTFFLLLLALIPLAYSNTFPSLTAEFCDWCTTTEAAQQKAWSLSPPRPLRLARWVRGIPYSPGGQLLVR